MRTRALVVLAVTLLIAADEPKDQAAKKEMKSLQGTWRAESAERQGQQQDDAKEHTLILDGSDFTVKKGDQVIAKGTFKVDPTKDPKTIDFKITEGDDKGKVAQGIYILKGDQLKWCSAQPGQEDRPTKFATKEGVNHMLVVLKREKPEK